MDFKLNIEEIKENLDDDMELVLELIDGFVEMADEQIEEVRLAVRSSNPAEAAMALHSLKGAVAIFCAHELQSFTGDLELLAKRGQLPMVDRQLEELLHDVRRLTSALVRYREAA